MSDSRLPIGAYDPALAEAAAGGENDEEVAVIARLSDSASLPPGARVVTRFGEVVTLRVRRESLADLAECEGVLDLEASRKLRADEDPPPTGALNSSDPAEAEPGRRPPGLLSTGRGTVVGVLDWGCDFAHSAFRNDDGTTRLLAVWDQRRDDPPGNENRWGYGRIFAAEQINRALSLPDPYEALGYHPSEPGSRRGGAHGTHVLDIAAGNGGGGGLPGVAPEADLVFVDLSRTSDVLGRGNLGDSATVLEALDFVFSVAGDRPCVVNMSVGAHGGPHDGTTLVEQGVDRAVSLESGRAVVNSAGNYFTARAHTQGRVRSGEELDLPFTIASDDPTDSELEVWYPGVDRLTATVIDPSGRELASTGVGEDASLSREGAEVGRIYHLRQPTNGDNQIDVFLGPHAPVGTWTLRLRGDGVEDGRFHGWIERERGPRPRFSDPHVVESSTTGTLCNGRLSIAVGACDARGEALSLARFSSAGPTRDGRMKPELVAPGVRIRAARSTAPGETAGSGFTTKSGTSMAAPHVTGTVALMFEAAGRPLEIHDLRALLFASTGRRLPGELGVTGVDLHRYGHGLLDIAAAERAAREWGRADRFEATEAEYLEQDDWREEMRNEYDSGAAGGLDPAVSPAADSEPFFRLDLSSDTLEPGDILVRSAPFEGVFHSATIVSGRLESVAEIAGRGLPVEGGGTGTYVEVLEIPVGGGASRRLGRRLTDAWGRLPRGQSVVRASAHAGPDEIAENAAGSVDLGETVGIDDVAIEMNGLRCQFVDSFLGRKPDGTTMGFASGSVHAIEDWNGTSPDARIGGFDVPKVFLAPRTDRVSTIRPYVVRLDEQRNAVAQNAERLRGWRGSSSERARLEELLRRRQVIYSRMWVRQMMYNRFDPVLQHWTAHYNRSLRPAAELDPNVVKSILYQESRMGTSGAHLMLPPYDWSSGSHHPIKSRFNVAQAIDSWGPQQWLMIREMAPSIYSRHGLGALATRRRWLGMSNDEYNDHPTFLTALREFFAHRDSGRNLMGTPGRDLHEDYAFWIRTGIRWLFVKLMSLRAPSWSEAVRAYNGAGPRAVRYRDEVMARAGSLDPFLAEDAPEDDADTIESSSPVDALTEDDWVEDRNPVLDTSARLEWIDLHRIPDSRGGRQVFYVVSGAPAGVAPAGYEGKARFRLRVRNTNSVYNHQNVVTKVRLLDILPDRQMRVAWPHCGEQALPCWRSIPGQDLEDETSRVIPLTLGRDTLLKAYNSESPLTRLEIEYHWREAFESAQIHYNRTGLDFALVAPIEFLLGRRTRLTPRDLELKDPGAHKDDYWIHIGGVDFTRDIRQPVVIQLEINSSVRQDTGVQRGTTSSQSRSSSVTHSASRTFSLQLSGEVSQGGSASANVEILELGLQQMFKLGGSMGFSRTVTDTRQTSVAREFSQSLLLSQAYSTSQAMAIRTTITVSPPEVGPSGTGRSRTASSTSVGVYLYPLVAYFDVPYVRFHDINELGQARRRTEGRVAVPYVTGWRLTTLRGG